MTVSQARFPDPDRDDVLDFLEAEVRALQEAGGEPRFVVVGPRAYEALRQAVARRYGRSAGVFEQYQWLTVVVDPFREAEACVLPAPRDVAEGVRAQELD